MTSTFNSDEVYISKDNTVAKYVHESGTETTIKTLPKNTISCSGDNRNKFNVFISCSKGCQIGCKFCFLHVKKYTYDSIPKIILLHDVRNAIAAELLRRPELVQTPINLSWMGMGEPWFNLSDVFHISKHIFNTYSNEVEGVDIATTLPIIKYTDIQYLNKLDKWLSSQLNDRLTPKPKNRANIRIFYSLHSLDNSIRKTLIPKTIDLDVALPYLESLHRYYNFNVIYHCMFLEGVNDSDYQVAKLAKYFYDHPDKQLRILRYNKCTGSKYDESQKFNEIIQTLHRLVPNLKVQISPGSEICAACGMFIMKYIK